MTGFVERGEEGAGDGFEDSDYARMGIEPVTARGWRRWGLQPDVARKWLDAGVDDPVDAVRWHPAVQPDEVQGLMAQGMTSDILARWREHGASVKEALAGHLAGKKPEDRTNLHSGSRMRVAFRQGAASRGRRAAVVAEQMPEPEDEEDSEALVRTFMSGTAVGISYLQIGWCDDEARRWSEAGIEALDARDWLALGLTVREAKECEDLGLGATDVALTWWRAGFAPDEVASWVGAGLSPAEALEQKEKGVTVEQAEVMRSLRQSELGSD